MHSRGMAINGFACLLCCTEFGPNLGILEKNPGDIHHFGEMADIFTVQERFHALCIKVCPCAVKGRGRNTRWCPHSKMKGAAFTLGQHKFYSLHPQYVGDLMGINHRSQGPVADCLLSKGRGTEHGTFHVDVGIDKSGE